MIGNGCIDVHAHAFSGDYVRLLAELGAKSEVMHTTSVFSASHQERIEVMDYGGVERQVLSMSAATPYFDDEASAVRAARFINDEHAEMCRRYPQRFSFFCVLPMPHVDASLAEFARCVDELGSAGVTFTTQIGDRPLADPAFAAIFAELDRREQVVFLHPPGLACASPIIRDSGLSWSIGAPIEDAVCAMQLMRADFPRRYPRMKIILPHLGGFIAFVRYRLGRSADKDIPSPVEQMRKFWYDTANGEPAALIASIECYGIDRLLFGTDYPYWLPGTGYEQAVGYLEQTGLTPDQVTAVRYGNARKIFGKAV